MNSFKAFTDVYKKTSFGICSLEGLAYNIQNSEYVCSIINAKNNNAYAGLFQFKDGIYKLVENYLSDDIELIINTLSKYKKEKITFVGDGSIEFKGILEKNFSNCIFAKKNDNNCNAESIGIAAYNHLKKNLNYDNSLSPMYLKKSQAERQLEEGKLK